MNRLPSELKVEHDWRTREDPFEDVWSQIEEQLQLNPGPQGKTLFEWLQRNTPGKYQDGQRIATAGQDATVKLWEPNTGVEIMSLNDFNSSVRCVEWSPDGRKLAAGSLSGDVSIWDATLAYAEIDEQVSVLAR